MLQKLEPQTGTSFELKKGQYLKVIDPCGEQVADLYCFEKKIREIFYLQEDQSITTTVFYFQKLQNCILSRATSS